MIDVEFLKKYVPESELKSLLQSTKGEEGEYFEELLQDLIAKIKNMPPLYANEKLGLDAIVKLHYFIQQTDFWITELNQEDRLGFGYICLNGDTQNAELGYISIPEILSIGDNNPYLKSLVQLDLHWQEKTLKEIINEVKGI